MSCILCNCELNDANRSYEHVILAAIGGRHQFPDILCKPCNDRTGHEWDAELASKLNPLSLLFSIQRQRGTVPAQNFDTLGGEQLRLNHDGTWQFSKPQFEKNAAADGAAHISFQARTEHEAKQMLIDLKRRYPALDVDAQLAKLQVKSIYPETPIKMSFGVGGPRGGRSMVKSVVVWAASQGIEMRQYPEALRYLQSPDATACFGYYYETDVIACRPVGVVLHAVAISNRNTQGQLLGYVEYYGVQRAVVRLAENYSGPDIHSCLAIDPVSGLTLTLDFELPFSNDDIRSIYNYEKIPEGSIEHAFQLVMSAELPRIQSRDRERLIDEAVRNAFDRCGAQPGESLSAAHLETMCAEIMEHLRPYLVRQLRSRRSNENDD